VREERSTDWRMYSRADRRRSDEAWEVMVLEQAP
jgi:hypothetical protein